MAAQLITVEEFKVFRDLGYKVDTDKATEAIRESQQVELYDNFGQFVFDIIANKDEATYTDLMNGSTFTVSGYDFIQEGIKSLLADFAYARYLSKIAMNLTPFGITIKIAEDSQPVDKKTIDEMIMKTLQDADVKKQLIDKYLINTATSSLFERYSRKDIGVISKTSRRYRVI